MLIVESVVRLLTCGMNRWSRIMNLGINQIRGELDIFNYLRGLRLTKATVNALTSFNQRRLLMAQVETSFLLQPFKKEDDEDGKKRGGKHGGKRRRRGGDLGDGESSSEESEEDFAFLDQELKDNRELDEVSQRLLAGIIQAPARKYKREDKLTKEEIWERRRQKAREAGEVSSDDYGDEMDDEAYGTIENDGDTIQHGVFKDRRAKRNKIHI